MIGGGSEIVREVLKLVIESHVDWNVCAEAVDGAEAVRKAQELKPDVVVLDLAMDGLNGLYAAREISGILPSVPILLHTVINIPAVVAEADRFGMRRVSGEWQG